MLEPIILCGEGLGGGVSRIPVQRPRFLVFIGLPDRESKLPNPGPAQLSAGLELEPRFRRISGFELAWS